MDELTNKLVEQSEGVLTEVYKDALSPAVKPVGQILGFLPRTIRIWFSGWEKWIINKEETLEATAKAIQDKVKNIPEEKITTPEAYVAIPAMQQLTYCQDSSELREMYANLLVSSMNVDKKWNVHPGFVDIIKQLTPDEAKWLRCFPVLEMKIYPMIDVGFKIYAENIKTPGTHPLIRNFTTEGLEILEHPENICTYIDNLYRLGIIGFSESGLYMNGENIYEPLENHQIVKNKMPVDASNGSLKIEAVYTRRFFFFTSFGLSLIRTCCDK